MRFTSFAAIALCVLPFNVLSAPTGTGNLIIGLTRALDEAKYPPITQNPAFHKSKTNPDIASRANPDVGVGAGLLKPENAKGKRSAFLNKALGGVIGGFTGGVTGDGLLGVGGCLTGGSLTGGLLNGLLRVVTNSLLGGFPVGAGGCLRENILNNFLNNIANYNDVLNHALNSNQLLSFCSVLTDNTLSLGKGSALVGRTEGAGNCLTENQTKDILNNFLNHNVNNNNILNHALNYNNLLNYCKILSENRVNVWNGH